jgi:hypothetical protein
LRSRPTAATSFGSSYYTGVSNIFRYELATGELEAMTNAETGFFRPVPLDDGSMLVFRFTGDGWVPSVIRPQPLKDVNAIAFFGNQVIEKHPVLKSWAAGSPASVPIESMFQPKQRYNALKRMRLESSVSGARRVQGHHRLRRARALFRSGRAEPRHHHGVVLAVRARCGRASAPTCASITSATTGRDRPR